MATEADIPALTCETRREKDENITDQATNVSIINKLSQEENTETGTTNEPPTVGEIFLTKSSTVEVHCEVNNISPDASKGTENPDQTTKDETVILPLRNPELDDQPLEIAANEETSSKTVQQDAEKLNGSDKDQDKLNVQIRTTNENTWEEKTIEEDISRNATCNVSNEEDCHQSKMTSEWVGLGNERGLAENLGTTPEKSNQENSTFAEAIICATYNNDELNHSDPTVTEKTEEISLIRGDGSETERDEPLEKDSETKLHSTADGTNGTKSAIIDNDLGKAEMFENEESTSKLLKEYKSLHVDTEIPKVSHSSQENITASCPEEQSTDENLHVITTGDSEEKTIDAVDVQKEVSENLPAIVSNEETEDKAVMNVDDSETKTEGLSERESEKTSLPLPLAMETNDDEQMVMHEARIEDGELKDELCESEKSTNNMLLKMESEIDKAEDQTGIEARDYSEEQSVAVHTHVVLDEKTDGKTSNVAETKEAALDVQNFSTETEENSENKVDGSETKNKDIIENRSVETSLNEAQIEDGKLRKDEFCENEKSTDSTLLKIESEIEKPEDSLDAALESNKEKPKDSMDAASEDIQDLGQDIETRSSEDVQTIISNDTGDKSLIQVDCPETKNAEHLEKDSDLPTLIKDFTGNVNYDELTVTDEVIIEDKRAGREDQFEKEKNIGNASLTEPVQSFHATLGDFKPSDLGPNIETFFLEEQSLTENTRGIPGEKTETTIDATDANEKSLELENFGVNVLNENNDKNSLVQVDAFEVKHATYLEKEIENASIKEASTEDGSDDKSTIVDGLKREVELLGSEQNIDSTLVKKENKKENLQVAQAIISEKTVDAIDMKEVNLEDDAIKIPREHSEEDTVIQVAGSQMDHEEHLEKESENSSSTEAPTGTTNGNESKNMHETKERNDGIVKDELLENEKSKISNSEKEEEDVEKAIDSLQAASEDIEEFDSSRDTNISLIEEKTQQEISSDHTEMKTIDANDTNEETIEDIATNISDGDNEENSPIGEDGTQKPSLEEASPGKASDNEPTIVHEAKFVDAISLRDELLDDKEDRTLVNEDVCIESSQVGLENIKAYASGEDRETSSQEEQSLTTNPQGTMDDNKEDGTYGTVGAKEEIPEDKNAATVSPLEDIKENTVIQVDCSHELNQNEHLENESENTSLAEDLAGDTSESNLVREEALVEKLVDSLQVDTEDIKASASSQEMETSCNLTACLPEISSVKIEREIIDAAYTEEILKEQDIAINVPNGDNEDNSPIEVDGSQKPSSTGALMGITYDDEPTIINEAKHAGESSVKAEVFENERNIECTVVKEEVSIESLQVIDEDVKQSSDQNRETGIVEEQCQVANPQGIIGDQKGEETTDATVLKEVNPADKIKDLWNVATPIPHEDTEANLQVAIEDIEGSNPSQDTETSSVKEPILAVGPQEISGDKTKEENIDATDTKEEDVQVQDIGTNVRDGDNEENSPIEVDDSKKIYLEEACHESAITLEENFVDASLTKAEPFENEESAEGTLGKEEISTESLEIEAEAKTSGLSEDRGTSSLEQQSLSLNPQRILADNEEDKTIDPTDLKEETSKDKVPEEIENAGIKAKDIELNEEDNCLEDPQTAAEGNIAAHEENSSNSIPPTAKNLDVDKDVVVVDITEDPNSNIAESSVKEMSEERMTISNENVTKITSLESEESESDNVVAEANKSVLDDGSITIPTKENLVETDPKESTESESQAPNGEKEAELVQQVLEAGTDQNETENELIINASQDVSESNEVNAEGEKRDTFTEEIEKNVQLCHESSNGSEITQEKQKLEEALLPALENTDSTEREVLEDAAKTKFIEHPEEDDTTQNLLDEEKPTGNEKDETECRQEEALLDETVEEIKQSTSIPVANDFPTKSFTESSEGDHSTTEGQQVEGSSTAETSDLISPEDKVNELENVATPITHEDTEANLLIEADCSQMEQKEYLQKESENSSWTEVPTGETTEGALLKKEAQKEKPTDSFQVAIENIKASNPSEDTEASSVKEQILTVDPQEISGDKTKEENIDATDTKVEDFQVQDIGTNVRNGDNEENSPIEVDDSQKLSLEEACHETSITLEDKFVGDSLTKAEQFENEKDVEGTLRKEEISIESSEVEADDTETYALSQEREMCSLEEQSLSVNPQRILGDNEENKTNDPTDLKEETSKDKVPEEIENVGIKAKDIELNEEDNYLKDPQTANKSVLDDGSITIPTKENLVEADPKESTESESQAPDKEKEAELEKIEKNVQMCHASSDGSEITQETQQLEETVSPSLENKIENIDSTEREVVEDATKTVFIEHPEEDDTTENLLDEKKPKEDEKDEKALLDETVEEIKQSTSIPVANDFPQKTSTETSEVDHSTTDGQLVESTSIAETSDLISRCEIDEYEHEVEEKMDSTEDQFAPEENKSAYESGTPLLESVSQVQTCDLVVSKAEETKLDVDENLEARNVDISSEKFEEEDEKAKDYHLGSCKEVVTEISLDGQVKQEKEITTGEIFHYKKDSNETENVPKADDEAKGDAEDNILANESIDGSLQQGKSSEEVTTILDAVETNGLDHAYINIGIQDSREEVNGSTVASIEDEDTRTEAEDADIDSAKDEGLLNQNSNIPVTDESAGDLPNTLDENIICEAPLTTTVHKTIEDSICHEEDNKHMHERLLPHEVTQEKESEKQGQEDEICSSYEVQVKAEENPMLSAGKSEEENSAHTWSILTEEEGRNNYVNVEKLDSSSHIGDTSEVSHSDGVHDIPEDSKNSTIEDEYPNKSTETQISTLSKGIELTEQASKATTTDEMQEPNAGSDSGAVPEAIVVDNQQVDEISVVCEGMAEPSVLIEPSPLSTPKSMVGYMEAKDEKSELHDLLQESNAGDSEVKEAQKDDPANLQNVVDVCEDLQELNEASVEMSSKEKAVEADPNQNIEVRVSSEVQEAAEAIQKKPLSESLAQETEAQQPGMIFEAGKGVNCDEDKTTDDKCNAVIENACQEAAEKVSESNIDQMSMEDTTQTDKYEDSQRQIDSLPISPHGSTELEVTPLPSKDMHAVLAADYTNHMNPENSSGKKNISAIQHEDAIECSETEREILKASEPEPEEANCAHEETTKSGEKSESKKTDNDKTSSLSDCFHVSTETKPTTHKEDLQAEKVDEGEHDKAKTEEEKDDEDESSEQRRSDTAPVMADMGDAEVKSAHKKSHNILSGVGSKVKHSIAKVKKAIAGKSSHPKPTSPK